MGCGFRLKEWRFEVEGGLSKQKELLKACRVNTSWVGGGPGVSFEVAVLGGRRHWLLAQDSSAW